MSLTLVQKIYAGMATNVGLRIVAVIPNQSIKIALRIYAGTVKNAILLIVVATSVTFLQNVLKVNTGIKPNALAKKVFKLVINNANLSRFLIWRNVSAPDKLAHLLIVKLVIHFLRKLAIVCVLRNVATAK